MTRLAIKDIKQKHDHCSKLELTREEGPSPTHYANHTIGGAGKELALCRIFFVSRFGKGDFANLYYKCFLIIFRNKTSNFSFKHSIAKARF
jgi:hypothetical protein